jgi:hypothetical protein
MFGHSIGKLLLVWLGCTLLLTAGDQFHTQFGVISYANPGPLWGQAWWVAPLFALATIGFVGGALPFASKIRQPSRGDFIAGALWFFGSYAVSGVMGEYSVMLTLIYVALWAMRVIGRSDQNTVITYSIILATAGTLAESALHYSGMCRYQPRDFLLVPMWLPALYLQGAPLALAIARWLRYPEATAPPASSP